MAKVNTHGFKMIGLKKASGMTTSWSGYTQISYNRETGEIYCNDHDSLNSWSEYHDHNIFTVAKASSHMTMQEIADAIAEAVEWQDRVNAAI